VSFDFLFATLPRFADFHGMNRSRLLPLWLLSLLCLCSPVLPSHAGPGDEMCAAASNLLSALSPEQQAKATYPFTDEERFDWHFIPKARKGLPFKEMDAAQQKLAQALLNSGLSQRGYAKAVTIMSLDAILKEMEQGKGPTRDPDLYFFTIFGKPGPTDTWGWRVEGHHLSLNFVVRGDQVVSATPAFFGSNPAEVMNGPRKGLRVLGEEEDLGRQFINSLSPDEQKIAIITNIAPKEIITSNQRKVMLLNPPGIAASKMSGKQKDALLALISDYAHRHRAEVAADDLKKIEHAGLGKVTFAWAGSLEPGQGHYYRIQGPTFLLEFDDTQNNANHIHTVWRDFKNDFGEDILREHYETVPHAQ
jgi:hypothetical protein